MLFSSPVEEVDSISSRVLALEHVLAWLCCCPRSTGTVCRNCSVGCGMEMLCFTKVIMV